MQVWGQVWVPKAFYKCGDSCGCRKPSASVGTGVGVEGLQLASKGRSFRMIGLSAGMGAGTGADMRADAG